jgi:hypothetical protein
VYVDRVRVDGVAFVRPRLERACASLDDHRTLSDERVDDGELLSGDLRGCMASSSATSTRIMNSVSALAQLIRQDDALSPQLPQPVGDEHNPDNDHHSGGDVADVTEVRDDAVPARAERESDAR